MLNQRVYTFQIFIGIAKFLSKNVIIIYTSAIAYENIFAHIFATLDVIYFSLFDNPLGKKCYLIIILIIISWLLMRLSIFSCTLLICFPFLWAHFLYYLPIFLLNHLPFCINLQKLFICLDFIYDTSITYVCHMPYNLAYDYLEVLNFIWFICLLLKDSFFPCLGRPTHNKSTEIFSVTLSNSMRYNKDQEDKMSSKNKRPHIRQNDLLDALWE